MSAEVKKPKASAAAKPRGSHVLTKTPSLTLQVSNSLNRHSVEMRSTWPAISLANLLCTGLVESVVDPINPMVVSKSEGSANDVK